MDELDDKRADETFIAIAELVSGFRTKNPECVDTEIAYALLQICACIDDGAAWKSFLNEALAECIFIESSI